MLALLFGISWQAQAQLVNIESRRMQTDSIRFTFRGDLSTSYVNNNGSEVFQIGSNLATQVKSRDLHSIWFLIVDYKLIRAGGADFENAWMAHVRFNREITHFFRVEAFYQSQLNRILDVNARNLIGGGIRLKLLAKDHARLYWGHAYMYELEHSDELDLTIRDHRYSTYLSFSANFPNSKVSILNTIYFQPLFRSIQDFRILEQFKLDVPVSEKVNLFAGFDHFVDSITPRNRRQFNTTTKFGIGLKL